MRRQKGLSFYRKRKKISQELLKEICTWIFGSVFSMFLAYMVVYFVGISTSVIGESMEPNLYNGQKIFIDRFSYVFSSPKRGDIVVFKPNGNENTHYYVKRIVAVPGDEVQILNGWLYINDIYIDDGYDKIENSGIAENIIYLKKDEYFVLGDNRNSSEDSRSANIGPIHEQDFVGKAWFKLGTDFESFGFIR